MYYVVETSYIGPCMYQDDYADIDTVEIRTEPLRYDNGEICVVDQCQPAVNDFVEIAHGEYETIEEARAAIEPEKKEYMPAIPMLSEFQKRIAAAWIELVDEGFTDDK